MNKAFRWIVLLLFFLLGAGCFVLYFSMSSDDAGTEGKQAVTGTLLTGTVPLGKLTVLSDGSLAGETAAAKSCSCVRDRSRRPYTSPRRRFPRP